MNKTLLIFKHELGQTLKKASFLAITLAIPVLALAAIGVFALASDGTARAAIISQLGNVLIPSVFALLLALSLMFGSVTLINSFGEEKESRLIEVLFSSVSIRQLLAAKILALGCAGLIQVLLWLISFPLLLSLASTTFGGIFAGITVPTGFLELGIAYFILGYLLFAVLSAGVGAIAPSAREGSQLSMIYTLTSFVPLWFSSLLFAFPGSPIWVVLSIIPVTAPIQVMVRLGMGRVPGWQIAVSLAVLAASAIIGFVLAVRIFRVQMLMHGKRPRLREIIASLKEG